MVSKPTVLVLLATHNGEKYLQAQIESIKNQKGNFNLSILASDDESVDNSREILLKNKIDFLNVKNIGACKNFLLLLSKAKKADYYAFADQDDVWDTNKIQIAIDSISKVNGPCLYIGSVINSKNGKIYKPNDSSKTSGFMRNKSQGCTMLFNKHLHEHLIPKHTQDIIMHDWWVKIIASCIGTVVYDERPFMTYRIHSKNDTGYPSKYTRIRRALCKLQKFEMLTIQVKQLKLLKNHLNQTVPILEASLNIFDGSKGRTRAKKMYKLTQSNSKKTEVLWLTFCSFFTR